MIVILKRQDLLVAYAHLPINKIMLHHARIAPETIQQAELIVYVEDNTVSVLKGDKWAYGKAMSAADLFRYIAEHAKQSEKAIK
jgi:hypothetical protein